MASAAMTLVAVPAASAAPQTFVVDMTGSSTPAAPDYTLATAITAADDPANAGSTIEFAASLNLSSSNTDVLTESLPPITEPMTIDGCSTPGQTPLSVSACQATAFISTSDNFPVTNMPDENANVITVAASSVTIRGLGVNIPNNSGDSAHYAIYWTSGQRNLTVQDCNLQDYNGDVLNLNGDDALIGGLSTTNSQPLGGNTIGSATLTEGISIEVVQGNDDQIEGNSITQDSGGQGLQIDAGTGTQVIANAFSQTQTGNSDVNGIYIENGATAVQVGQPGDVDPLEDAGEIAPPNTFSGFDQPIELQAGATNNVVDDYQATGTATNVGDGNFLDLNGNDPGVENPTITSATTDAVFGMGKAGAEVDIYTDQSGTAAEVDQLVAQGTVDPTGNFAISFVTGLTGTNPVHVGTPLIAIETLPGDGSSAFSAAIDATSPPVASFTASNSDDTDPATNGLRPFRPNAVVNFDASASTNVGAATSEAYEWNWGDGTPGSPDITTTSGKTTTHTYTTPGVYTVTLLLTDTTGAGPEESFTTQTVTVSPDSPPVPVIQTPGTGAFNTTIAFNGGASYDPDGAIENYQVTLKDSGGNVIAADNYNSNSPPSTINLPTALGTYRATLTVTDDEGVTGSSTVPITVTNPPAPPSTPAPVTPVGSAPSSTLDSGQTNMLNADTQATGSGQPLPVVCGTATPSLASCLNTTELTSAGLTGHTFAVLGASTDLVMDTSGSFAVSSVATDASGGFQITYSSPDLNINGVAIQPVTAGQGTLTEVTDIDGGKLDYVGLTSSAGSSYAISFDGMRLFAGPINLGIYGPGSTTGAPASGFDTQFNISGQPALASFTAQIGVNNSYNGATPALNGLSVASFTPFTFAQGQANTQVTNQLPSALGQPAAGQQAGSSPGPTSPSPIPVSNNSVASAIGQAEMLAGGGDDLLGSAPASLFGGSTDPLSLSQGNADAAGGDCGTRLKGTLPTGPQAVTVGFPAADLGGIQLSGVQMTIDGPNHFILEAQAALPTGDASLEAMVEIENGQFRFGCAEASFSDPGISIGPAYLISIGVGVLNNSTQWVVNGNVEFTAGPTVLGEALLQADLDMTVVFPTSTAPAGTPWGLNINGSVDLLPGLCNGGEDESDDPDGTDDSATCGVTADGNLTYVSTGYVAGSLSVQVDLAGFDVNGTVAGNVNPSGGWAVGGEISLTIPDSIPIFGGTYEADAYVTNENSSGQVQNKTILSACVGATGQGGPTFGGSVTFPFKGLSSVSTGPNCSLGLPSQLQEPTCASLQSVVSGGEPTSPQSAVTNYFTDETLLAIGPPDACSQPGPSVRGRVGTAPAGRTHARPMILTAHASGSTVLEPGQAEPFEVGSVGATEQITAVGAGAPPNIEVLTPDGADYATPVTIPGHNLLNTNPPPDGYQNPATNTTTIWVTGADEQAGAWSVYVDPGSAPVTNLTEQEDMNPSVTGSVTSTGARTEQLSYNDQVAPGSTVQFVEIGSDSSTVIGTAGPGQGTLTWNIGDGSAGTRTVEAQVMAPSGGVEYANNSVTTFTAPGPELPAAPSNLSLTSDGKGGATLSWTPDSVTHRVIATVTGANGMHIDYSEPITTTSVDIPNVVSGSQLTATLYGEDAEERGGASGTVTATIGSAATVTPHSPPTFTPVNMSTKPTISGLKQTLSRWKEGSALATASKAKRKKKAAGTVFSFTLNTAARVTLAFTQPAKGTLKGAKCVASAAKAKRKRKAKPCRTTAIRGSLSYQLAAGAHKVSFDGVISRGKKLKPGAYALSATATNSAGTSVPATLKFKILKS